MFIPIWGRFPFWLIFIKWVEPPTRISWMCSTRMEEEMPMWVLIFSRRLDFRWFCNGTSSDKGWPAYKIASDSTPILQYGECDSTENGSRNNSHVDNLFLNLQYIAIIMSQTSFVGRWAAWDFATQVKPANMQNGRAKMVHQSFCSPFAKSGCKSFPTVAWGVLYSCNAQKKDPLVCPSRLQSLISRNTSKGQDCMVSMEWCLPTPITIYNVIYRDPISPYITPTFSNGLEYFRIHLSYIYGINVGIDIPFSWSIWDWWRAHLLVFPFSIMFLFFTSDVCSPALWWDRIND